MARKKVQLGEEMMQPLAEILKNEGKAPEPKQGAFDKPQPDTIEEKPKPKEDDFATGRKPWIEIDFDGENYFWVLVAANGKQLSMSTGEYPRRNDCVSAVEAMVEAMKQNPKIMVVQKT